MLVLLGAFHCPGLGESAAGFQAFFGVNTLCACTRWGPQAGLAEAAAGRGERRRRGNGRGGGAPGPGSLGASEPDVAASAAAWGRGCWPGNNLVNRRKFGLAPRLPWGPQYPEKQAQIAPSALCRPSAARVKPTHCMSCLGDTIRRASRRTDAKWR